MIDSLRPALAPIAQDDRYRLWPVYSIAMLAMWWALMRWPVDRLYVHAIVEYPLFYEYYKLSHMAYLFVAVALGLVGLARRPWPARLLAATGAYVGVDQLCQWAGWYWNPLGDLHYFIVAGIWLAPIDWITEAAYGSRPLIVSMYAIYLIGVLVVARKLVLWGASRLARRFEPRLAPLAAWLDARRPRLEELGRRVL